MKNPTKEQIQAWKDKHGTVVRIDVPNITDNGDEVIKDGKDTYSGIFKDVDRRMLSLASKKSSGLSDPIKFNETIVYGCFVDGDQELKSQDAFINAVSERLQERIKSVEAEIKEL